MDKQEYKRGLKPLQRKFFNLLGQEKPKPIPPKLVRIYGYPLSAMVSQLLYWYGTGSRQDGLIYKTEDEFRNEIGLSSAQQKLAIKKGRAFGFLEVSRRGIPAKRHYRLNYDALVAATVNEAERKKIVLSKGYYKFVEKRQSKNGGYSRTITNNTQESTTKKKSMESTADILARKYGTR